ncbi:PREDICTED: uncharacterized protein LOC101806031 [Ficedula albicollis]|uniref:uncharacterized protein LOC101806031 n=1 Tax=Ficedula albicollis TaxID=59894 RepID=UPI000359EE62|nr:PREDICTED: uncharacterized protein LOC101806031 [Ficedula albicollis]
MSQCAVPARRGTEPPVPRRHSHFTNPLYQTVAVINCAHLQTIIYLRESRLKGAKLTGNSPCLSRRLCFPPAGGGGLGRRRSPAHSRRAPVPVPTAAPALFIARGQRGGFGRRGAAGDCPGRRPPAAGRGQRGAARQPSSQSEKPFPERSLPPPRLSAEPRAAAGSARCPGPRSSRDPRGSPRITSSTARPLSRWGNHTEKENVSLLPVCTWKQKANHATSLCILKRSNKPTATWMPRLPAQGCLPTGGTRAPRCPRECRSRACHPCPGAAGLDFPFLPREPVPPR